MALYIILNKITKSLELILISLVISFYMLSTYDTLTSSRKFPLYFLLISFYHYINILLTKSTTDYTDFSKIKGICKKCNKITDNRTKHCEICNTCYYKRDHHCIMTGKCIASHNFKNLYFSMLFILFYFLSIINRDSRMKEFLFFYKFLGCLIFFMFFWINFLIVVDKTSGEFFMMDGSIYECVRVNRLRWVFKDGVVCILCPFIKKESRIVC